MPETSPLPEETVATRVLALLHTPPEVPSVKDPLLPVQTINEAGAIAAGVDTTVKVFVAEQVPTV